MHTSNLASMLSLSVAGQADLLHVRYNWVICTEMEICLVLAYNATYEKGRASDQPWSIERFHTCCIDWSILYADVLRVEEYSVNNVYLPGVARDIIKGSSLSFKWEGGLHI